MTVTDDVRAAKRERQFHSARDFETSASQIGEIAPLGEEMKRKTQLLIAGNAKGRSKKAQREDAELLMRMLGVHPDDTFDPTLSNAMPLPSANPGRR
jgi:hypothetical protein